MQKKKTFLISPVRDLSPDKLKVLSRIVKYLEKRGWQVHWPYRDTDQIDLTGGLKICQNNMEAIVKADFVHIIWDGKSKGCLFDFGIAFALNKIVIPLILPALTNEKSFQNVIWRYYQKHKTKNLDADIKSWMFEEFNNAEEENFLDKNFVEEFDDSDETDENYNMRCCDWMCQDLADSNTLFEEFGISIGDDNEYYRDCNFYIRGNPQLIYYCPGCGRRLNE